MEKEFSYKKVFLLGFGFFGVSLIWALYNAYIPIFLKDFSLSSLLVGFLMTLDNILAVILQPFIGFLSDHTRSKLGRRMPFILVGVPVAAVFFLLVPVLKDVNLFAFLGAIIAMNIAMAIFRSPVVALMPDITPSKLRSKANGIINFMGGLGAFLAFVGGSYLYDINKSLPFIFGSCLLVVSAILLFVFIKEKSANSNSQDSSKDILSFSSAFKDLFSSIKKIVSSREKSELFLLIAIFLWFCGYGAIETFFTSYGKFFLGVKESEAALTLGLFSLVFMVFAIPSGFLGSKFGRKKMILCGLGLLIVVLILISVSKDFGFIRIILSIGGIGWALININSLPMIVDMVKSEKVGGYTGIYYFSSMLASIAAPPLVGFLIDLTNYPSMIVFSIISFFAAAFFMLFVKKGEAVKS